MRAHCVCVVLAQNRSEIGQDKKNKENYLTIKTQLET